MILYGINFVVESAESVKFAAGWTDMPRGNMGFFPHCENMFADVKSAQERHTRPFPF
jgi:hypothetical protein